MIVITEVLAIMGVFIVPVILSPKKKVKKQIDINTSRSEYGVDQNGYLVKLLPAQELH